MQRMIQVLWPSFIVAGAMDIVLFTLLDPLELIYQGSPLFDTRLDAYSVGFFLFWLFGAASSILTCYFGCNSTRLKHFYKPADSGK